MPNALIHETSPYLLQHAYQPVNWYPYSEDIFEKAQKEDKPLIISIGYSTCHWCHVMAHECFENTEIAKIMNEYFFCIKVDREELPDVDKYYMHGTQVLTGHGGWPLNAFVLPNKKMFYAVTYVPKEKWKELLKKIQQLYKDEKEKLYEYAENIHQGIIQFELIGLKENDSKKNYKYDLNNKIQETISNQKNFFDKEWGGYKKVPKFIMPINYRFLLLYTQFNPDKEIINHICNSITNIILGGIYDHVGGGFYRYSTDRYWKIPHFEKMLYDNAQMIELLSLYYLQYPSEEVKWIIEKNIHCILRDFYSDEQLFYSAWDADSEKQEGKFYTWTISELQNILDSEFNEFAEIFNINNHFGYWENDKYVLTINIPAFMQNKEQQIRKINQWTEKLYLHRKQRTHPSIDTKIITSWNSLMIRALSHAAIALNNPEYLKLAEKTTQQLLNKLFINHDLYRIYHKNKTKNPAYLDDYAFLIDALITLAKYTANSNYIDTAQILTQKCLDEFYSPRDRMFYYTNAKHPVSQSTDVYDDVIPSANAQMIKNLLYLARISHHQDYKTIAENILNSTSLLFLEYPQHAASYGELLLEKIFYDEIEICITGNKAIDLLQEVFPKIWFIRNIYTTTINNTLGIFKNKFHPQKTFIYVCRHSTCYEPVEDIHHFDIKQYLNM